MLKRPWVHRGPLNWIGFTRRYLAWVALLNLGWEFAQMPLYTLWNEGTTGQIAFASAHCTGGDVLIAAASLLVGRLLCGNSAWPTQRYWPVAISAVVLGLGYTAYSEWSNTVVTRSWAYAPSMPLLWGLGLAPIAQWVAVPMLIFWRLKTMGWTVFP